MNAFTSFPHSLFPLSLPFPIPNLTPTTIILPLILIYPIIQRSLRYQRERSELQKHGYAKLSKKESRKKLREMTMDEAGEIQRYMVELEFPNAYRVSLGYGFVQTLAFPESSALLHSTAQISSPSASPKRFVDTSLLITNIMSFPPSSPRVRKAISRMNYLHGLYGKKITNDQLLYVLGVFATNPWDWVRLWEWREMNVMEVGAMGVFWKGIGEMMGIDMSEMKGMGRDDPDYSTDDQERVRDKPTSQTTTDKNALWNDPIDWMIDMRAYLAYHDNLNLGYSDDVDALVKQTLDSGMVMVPNWAKEWMKDLVMVRFEERYRSAIRAREPSSTTKRIGMAIAHYKRFHLKYISLPRPRMFTMRAIAECPDPTTNRYDIPPNTFPWPMYVKPTFWSRWGPEPLIKRLLKGPLPGDEGDKYQPGGYKVEEIGPLRYEGKGHEWMEKDYKKGEEVMPAGKCPFGM